TADNVFILNEHGCFTPPTTTNLKGITRETIIELARDMGIGVTEARFALVDVWTAHEVWMCGTGAEVIPVRSVDGRQIGAGRMGPLTARIVEAYHQLVRTTGTAI